MKEPHLSACNHWANNSFSQASRPLLAPGGPCLSWRSGSPLRSELHRRCCPDFWSLQGLRPPWWTRTLQASSRSARVQSSPHGSEAEQHGWGRENFPLCSGHPPYWTQFGPFSPE
ncbi:unnamed protein product [Tetraodon nigroviridis]|uniref:(spotted green pufferfish) hypothetical protein n=1 Tax=Tetraodon nigroviridis TaxID=99883 RepID=Q4SAA2_TETNG|nr:unnamed protein product [Tetraodon nigroviridis]